MAIRHTTAYYTAATYSTTPTVVAPIDDAVFSRDTLGFRVNPAAPQLMGLDARSDHTAINRARMVAPTLTEYDGLPITRVPPSLTTADIQGWDSLSAAPLAMSPNESAGIEATATGSQAGTVYVVAHWGDGPIAPYTGPSRPVRGTVTATASTGIWVQGTIALDIALRPGRYDIVGARVEGAGLIAARFVPVGGGMYPGFLSVPDADGLDPPSQRRGGSGVYLTFDNVSIPGIQVLGESGTTYPLILDIVARG